MLFIGDVHAKFKDLTRLMIGVEDEMIQLGDMGIGFPSIPYPRKFPPSMSFLRGNHDNPAACRRHPNYLGDWGTWNGLFFVSGAYSIDRDQRVLGRDWWEDEELNWGECEKALNAYALSRPRIVVSHDGPDVARNGLLAFSHKGPSRTSNLLTAMFEAHAPELWVFGHHHRAMDRTIGRTRFVCLPELGTFKI